LKIYWSLKSIPELAELPAKERKELWRRCLPKGRRNWRTWVAGGCFAAFIGGVSTVLARIISGSLAVAILLASLIGGIGSLISFQFQVRTVRPYIRKELNLPVEEADQRSDWQKLFADQRCDL
jgi:hypothetical protein